MVAPSGPGKLSARIGQMFSKSQHFAWINISRIRIDDDFQFQCSTDHKNYCSSDGCGSISISEMARIAVHLGLINKSELETGSKETWKVLLRQGRIPTAIQVRFGGAKGMLAVDLTLPDGTFDYVLRPSMIKFGARLVKSSIPLDICAWSGKPSVGNMNKQLINILEYRLSLDTMDDKLNPIINAVQAAVDKYQPLTHALDHLTGDDIDKKALLDCKSFWERTDIADLIWAGVDPRDKYLTNYLETVPYSIMQTLHKKYNIPISESRRYDSCPLCDLIRFLSSSHCLFPSCLARLVLLIRERFWPLAKSSFNSRITKVKPRSFSEMSPYTETLATTLVMCAYLKLLITKYYERATATSSFSHR